MIIPTFIVLLLAFTLYYVFFLVRIQQGLRNLKDHTPTSQELPFASVVVAARNEERTIEQSVRAILCQRYPVDRFELIVVNDGSSDRTGQILAELATTQKNLQILSSQKQEGQGAVGKPASISRGVSAAKGKIILTTDADCFVPITWIATMVQYFEPNVAFAAGPVHERSNRTLLSRLSQMEYLGLITTTAGLIGAHHPIICSGANLAYRRSAFLAAQGFGSHGTWCDDETLMHRIRERNLGDIVFVPSTDATVETNSVDSLSSFWRQRLRWSAKGNHYESISILFSLIGLFFFFLFLLVTFVGSLFDAHLRMWFLISFAAKLVIDYSTLAKGAKLFQRRTAVLTFLIAEVFHVPYVVITAGLGQFISLEWKGRTIN
jgi:cellulose synthase/poly-beta-1,6-N-acetylglucosamine synthase-like glycosyltransferase